jgi:hypothetical protein
MDKKGERNNTQNNQSQNVLNLQSVELSKLHQVNSFQRIFFAKHNLIVQQTVIV